jgi:hypothetical protein
LLEIDYNVKVKENEQKNLLHAIIISNICFYSHINLLHIFLFLWHSITVTIPINIKAVEYNHTLFCAVPTAKMSSLSSLNVLVCISSTHSHGTMPNNLEHRAHPVTNKTQYNHARKRVFSGAKAILCRFLLRQR